MDPVTMPTRLLAARIWELRSNLTTCDAAYVAAAERYRCTLVTTDARLARAAGIQCTVDLILERVGRTLLPQHLAPSWAFSRPGV
jgi:hypothetical protein